MWRAEQQVDGRVQRKAIEEQVASARGPARRLCITFPSRSFENALHWRHARPSVFIYVRKSTDDKDRQVRSIDDQLAEVRELASRRSLHVIDVLIEKQSAKKPGRPVFNAMLMRIERGEADGILAWHPDRLARNMLDGGRIIHLLDTGVIKDLKFPTIDFQSNSQGKLTLAMLLA